MPAEGDLHDDQRVGALARAATGRHVVVGSDRTVAEAREVAGEATFVVATIDGDGDGPVDGIVPVSALRSADGGATLRSVLALDPPTVRPSLAVRELVDRWRDEGEGEGDVDGWTAVTTSRGLLVGILVRDELLALARADRLP